ncbi:MAG: filamentous hemagglutinin family protein [Pseudomonadota bacterium]
MITRRHDLAWTASAPTARRLAPRVHRLAPLVAALAAALPLVAPAAPKPAPATVPVPAASWRVYGTGSSAPVNTPNPHGGIDQTIEQTSTKGIYHWASFDIGEQSSVTFKMADKGFSALNRVTRGGAPSQIFGKLHATNGGEVLLINSNGILFGRGAQVDVGSLVASALNVQNDEYLSGFSRSLTNPDSAANGAAFRYDGNPDRFVDAHNFVRVAPGAEIVTESGGRVFLFAKRVENAGTITTPSGQVVLAGGGEIYFKLPTSEQALYASETNPAVSALRGFLVEVGSGPAHAPEGSDGSASNLVTGVINTPRGNTTLVGMAVNQMGRISATTSVSENGSVILRAQGRASYDTGAKLVRATAGGQLTLGEGSRIEIGVDPGSNADGSVATSTDAAGFATSHLDLAGHSVLFDHDATILAPGATVNVRAESVPSYDLAGPLTGGDESARIVMREGSAINVSGTTGTVVSVGREFVTTELLGSNDLKDAPLQKDGLLYRSKVTIDTREDSAILDDLDGYRGNIARSAEERLSEGGTVRLRAEGAVLTEEGTYIGVSGGQVRYTEAQVRETQLLGSDGKLYDLNNAPADLVYTHATNLQKSSLASYDRWGVQIAYGSVTPTRTEAGYTEGRDAGRLQIAAPTLVMQGQVRAGTVQGERQNAGQSPQASRGTLHLGAVVNGGTTFANAATPDAVLRNFSVTTEAPVVDEGLWLDPGAAELPQDSGVAIGQLQQAGFGEVAIAANGDVRFGDDASTTWQMADQGSLRLLSADANVLLGSSVRGAGATVELNSKSWGEETNPRLGGIKTTGEARVAEGVTVDLSGRFVNQSLRQLPLDTAGTAGGSFSATGYGVTLEAGTVVDVSGGGSVSTTGQFSGSAAGSITLDDVTSSISATQPTLVLGGELRGYSAASSGGRASGGGNLTLRSHAVLIGAPSDTGPANALVLGDSFFDQGGFSRFTIDGRNTLEVAAGADVSPEVRSWIVSPDVALASGQPLSALATEGRALGLRESAVSLSLRASGESGHPDTGELRLAEGARIDAGDQGQVGLSARHRLSVDGGIEAHGGQVSLSVAGGSDTAANVLWVGEHARIDVSGVTVIKPDSTAGLREGQVLDGGSITIDAGGSGQASHLVLQQGAVLDARGTRGQIDVKELSDAGVRTERRQLDSRGGSVSLRSTGDLYAEGDILLQGSGQAAGGSLAVILGLAPPATGGVTAPPRSLHLASSAEARTPGLQRDQLAAPAEVAGTATLGADWLAASGADNLTLASGHTLHLDDTVTLNVDGRLTLLARGLGAASGSESRLSGGQAFVGWTKTDATPNANLPLGDAPAASAGDAILRIEGRAGMVLDGKLSTQGLDRLVLATGGDLRLQSRDGVQGTGYTAGLDTPAGVILRAAQVYAASDTHYTLQATGRTVLIERPDGEAATPPKPLSANSTLTINAAHIRQEGVLRAPLGHIELNASGSLVLGTGSETSVSAAGLTALYGTATDSTWLTPGNTTLTTPPDKRIDLNAHRLTTEAGSVLDVSGGGELIATEFVPGKGGSTDILAGGGYALVPGHTALSSHDSSLSSAAAQGQQVHIAQPVKLPDGSVLAAGDYTLLPARYAVLPGAFLLRPASTGTPLADGFSVARTDGSVLLGARLVEAGSGNTSALPQTWQLMSKATLLKYSEIREHRLSETFADRAAQAGTAAPELPNDAGAVSIRAAQAQIEGTGRFTAAVDDKGQVLGQAGRTEIIADKIQIDAAPVAADDGVLHLSVASLNQLGGGTVVLGATGTTIGTDAAGQRSVQLTTEASSIVFAQGDAAITVGDLVASARDQLTVADGARFEAATSGLAAGSTDYAVAGDGAALRLSGRAGGSFTRQGATGAAGDLQVGEGAHLQGGSLTLDSSDGQRLAGSAVLDASHITLGARNVQVGGEPAADQAPLLLTPGLLAQVSGAEQLTLRAYDGITLTAGATLGTPGQKSLVLDTARLRSGPGGATAEVVAGEITLTNTTGRHADVAAGDGSIALHATRSAGGSGRLVIGHGAIGIDGTAQLDLRADQGLALTGDASLATAGDVRIDTPGIVAGQLAAELDIQAGGTLRIENSLATGPALSMDGGVFTASAQHIEQAGRIVLPSGRIELQGRDGVTLEAGSRTDVAGRSSAIDGVTIDQAGGSIALTSAAGDVTLATGSRADVSGSGAAGAGGSLSLTAGHSVKVDGSVTGQAGAEAAEGARFSADAGQALDTARLAARLQGQFTGELSLRQREGDLSIGPGQTFAAERISVSADAGALVVRGTLDASGANGGSIALAAGQGLALQGEGRLLAHATEPQGDGGRVDLGSRSGTIRVGEGTQISLGGQGDGQDGRLTLRAGRTEQGDVKIAELAGQIDGAGRIDVQAVKVYRDIHTIHDWMSAPGTLSYATVNAENRAFIGSDGAHAEAMAQRLAGGNQKVLDALKIHAEAEVRSDGDLAINASSDWVLPTESTEVRLAGGQAAHVGDSSLTLRAMGDLDVTRGIHSGFGGAGERSDQGGSIRLVAGASLQAAAPDATRPGLHTLTISRLGDSPVEVRTTTGDISLAASGDIDLTDRARVYNTGGAGDAQARADFAGRLPTSTVAFTDDAGDITVHAGRDVLSREVDQNGLMYGQANLLDVVSKSPTHHAWYADISNLTYGLGSFGGGNIDLAAGRDVKSVVAVAPSSGRVLDDSETSAPIAERHGGGNVSVRAGRDVVNGVVAAGAEKLNVFAGRDIVFQKGITLGGDYRTGLRLFYEDTSVTAIARRHADIGNTSTRFAKVNGEGRGSWLQGLDNDATLMAQAAAGNLWFLAAFGYSNDSEILFLPASTQVFAPNGNLAVGGEQVTLNDATMASALVQQPLRDGLLQMLSHGTLELGLELQVNASRGEAAVPGLLTRPAPELQVGSASEGYLRLNDEGLPDQGDRSPVHLVAETGDLIFSTPAGPGLESARPVRLVAGRDVILGEGNVAASTSRFNHQAEGELSLIQAGRDIVFDKSVVKVGGPGDIALLAGRDIDLGSAAGVEGSGLMAIGNTDNTLLPARSAAVTLVAGLKADGSDYQAAVAAGFHVLGSAGLTRHAGDLYALLAGDGSVPALGSADARAFEALDAAAQLDRIRTLMGAQAYDKALATYVRGLPDNGQLSDSAALAAFATQSQARRDAAPAALLASLLDDQPAATRQAFVLQVAQADGARTGQGLQAWMKLKTGKDLSLADAALAFEALPLERQVGWLNQVLVDELRTHGRSAATGSGYDAEAAYLRGYQAVNTVFAIDRPQQGGDIRLPSTQVKVLQAAGTELLENTDTERAVTLGAITLMAPGGGVNAGELGSTTQKPNNLGVVTVAGGDVAGVVERDFAVNQSRVFTLAEGDILLWASEGDIDAGRGAKTVSGAPAPVLRLNAATGRLELDTSGSFTGSGIAVLDAKSELDLYAPAGAIDAGEAGIKSRGNAFLGAQVVRGGDNLQFGGSAVGAPIAAPTVNPTASLSAAAAAAAPAASGDDEDERRRKRMARRTLLLEFLGFGRG